MENSIARGAKDPWAAMAFRAVPTASPTRVSFASSTM
jgi:hypothetical protein